MTCAVLERGRSRARNLEENSRRGTEGDWGETSQVFGSAANYNPYRYTGQQFDGETGLYYLRARSYAPGLGRFTSRDPIGYNGGQNPYSYCGGDPLNRVDPSGLDFYVYGDADAAHTLEYQLEQATGLSLSFGSDRRLKISGGTITNAAGRLLAQVIGSDTNTKVRAESGLNLYNSPGLYKTDDNIHNIFPDFIALMRGVDEGIGYGAGLFHEVGEAFSRAKNGLSNPDRERDHAADAQDFEEQVLADYGLTRPDPKTWHFKRKGKTVQLLPDCWSEGGKGHEIIKLKLIEVP